MVQRERAELGKVINTVLFCFENKTTTRPYLLKKVLWKKHISLVLRGGNFSV